MSSTTGAGAGVGTDIDDDDTVNGADAFRTDACASTDTDNDGNPDSLVPGCTTSPLTEDMDDDGDGEDDDNDNCPLVANADQANTDNADDDGDACDEDDDNDGVEDLADTCPRGVIGWTSSAGTDDDRDGCRDDDEDVDDNNNGLIEIHTLDDLARLRDDLNGDGEDDDRIPEITSVGSMGCPDPDDDDGGCVGYELTRSLNFGDADFYAEGSGNQVVWTNLSGSGWQPIGSCSAVDVCTSYTGIFDGVGYRIADLFISANNTAYGVGLFGALTGEIQNLHLLNADVSGDTAVVGGAVGGLVGDGRNADIRNASVSGGSVFGNVAGGLVGYGEDADIRHASVSGGSVIGDVAGGLVGNGEDADIRNASVSGGSVSGNVAGGLVGDGGNADIRYASVSGGSVSGNVAGGLVGNGEDVDIRYAFVFGVDVSFGSSVGGLVGNGEDADIRHAYVRGGIVSGGSGNRAAAGGLVGKGARAQINYSYAAPGPVSGSGTVGGLIGSTDGDTVVTATYWDNQTTKRPMSAGNFGEGHNTTDLQSPTDFAGSIYADWGNFWCDPDTGEEMTSSSQPPGFIRVWDLGMSSQYPALNCLPGGLSAQDR